MKKLLLTAFVLCLLVTSRAQVVYIANSADLIVSGTSTLHDWDMKSAKGNCTVGLALDGNGRIAALSVLNFSTPVDALKSDHTAMDNNAYKALKKDKNPTISFVLTTATCSPSGAGTLVKAIGRLTIAGTTKEESVEGVCMVNPDNSITITGSKKISMKDYNMQPPTFMMGTIKTGNDIVLKYTINLRRS